MKAKGNRTNNIKCRYEWRDSSTLECREHGHIVVVAWAGRKRAILKDLAELGCLGPKALETGLF